MDLFDFDGRHYLILVDYYSNFFEVESLPDVHASTTISKIRPVLPATGYQKPLCLTTDPNFATLNSGSSLKHGTLSISRRRRPATHSLMEG